MKKIIYWHVREFQCLYLAPNPLWPYEDILRPRSFWTKSIRSSHNFSADIGKISRKVYFFHGTIAFTSSSGRDRNFKNISSDFPPKFYDYQYLADCDDRCFYLNIFDNSELTYHNIMPDFPLADFYNSIWMKSKLMAWYGLSKPGY